MKAKGTKEGQEGGDKRGIKERAYLNSRVTRGE